MDLIIYSYGSGEALMRVFNAIVLVLRDHQGQVLKGFMMLGGLTGLMVSMVAVFTTQSLASLIRQWFIPTFILMNGVFLPTTTVKIVDPVFRTHFTVARVPWGLGVTASLFSHLSHALTLQLEKCFALPDDLQYHQNGSMFASSLLTRAQVQHIDHETINHNLHAFVNQCVVYEAMIGKKYSVQDLRRSTNLWELVTTHASKVRCMPYKEKGKTTIMTCHQAADALDSAVNYEANQVVNRLARQVFGGRDNQAYTHKILNALPTAFEMLTHQAQETATDVMRQLLLINGMVEAVDEKSVGLGNAPRFAAKRAYLQQRSTWQTYGDLASQIYPVLKSVLEALLYTLFIFLIPLSLIQTGMKLMLQWVRMVVWVHLWTPLYGLLNGIATYKAIHASHGVVNGGGLSIMTSMALYDVNMDWMATCSYLSLMGIPTMAWALVSGSQVALSNLAGSLTSSTQSMAQSAAQEAVTGNYSFGNVQAMNSQQGHVSAFQHNGTVSYQSGMIRSSDGHVDTTFSADGSTMAQVNRSNLPVSVQKAETQMSQMSDQYNDAVTTAQTQTMAAQESEAAAYRGVIEKGFSQQQSQSLAHGSSSQMSVQDQNAASTLASHAEKFAKSHNISTADATHIMAGLASGLSSTGIVKWLSPSLKGDTQTSAQSQQIVDSAKDYMNQHQLQQSLTKGVQEAQDQRFSHSDDQQKRVNDSIASSWDQGSQYRQEASQSMSRAQTLQHQMAQIQTNAATINRDATQEALEHIATQSRDGTGRPMGMREAIRMAHQDPQLFTSYARAWMEQTGMNPTTNLPTLGATSTGRVPSSEGLSQRYSSGDVAPSKTHQARSQYDQRVQSQPDAPLTLSDQGLGSRVQGSLNQASQRLEKDGLHVHEYKAPLQSEHAREADRSTMIRAGAHVVDNVADKARTFGKAVVETGKDFSEAVAPTMGMEMARYHTPDAAFIMPSPSRKKSKKASVASEQATSHQASTQTIDPSQWIKKGNKQTQ